MECGKARGSYEKLSLSCAEGSISVSSKHYGVILHTQSPADLNECKIDTHNTNNNYCQLNMPDIQEYVKIYIYIFSLIYIVIQRVHVSLA